MSDRPPQLFGLPPGVDFPAELVAGLLRLMARQPPDAMAKVTLILNTQRMRRRATEIFAGSECRFLPKLVLLTEIGLGFAANPPVPALRRRLDLTVLLDALLKTEETLFPRSALFDLADSLAELIDEMQGEGISVARIAGLNVAEHSAHWARTQRFLAIVMEALAEDAPDAEARQRLAIEAMITRWKETPPDHPVIVAGSTGSRGTTALLMQAVARLSNGFVVLPGFDFDLPKPAWASMTEALTAEDHPQYRFRTLLNFLGAEPGSVIRWTPKEAPAPDRNRLISLSLRPAPITDQWLTDGPSLGDLAAATRDLTLIEAPSERMEALAIALVLRESAEDGIKAALVTPDRNLTRRVAAVLDRWGIRPDDSAGQPLGLSAPGRFLRHIAALFGRKLTSDVLLMLLKHPLCFSGVDRGIHLRLTRELELDIRRNGPAFPSADSLMAWASSQKSERAEPWAKIIGQAIDGLEVVAEEALISHVTRHRYLTETLARGFATDGAGELWAKAAGAEALAAMTELEHEANAACAMCAADYERLFTGVLQRRKVRDAPQVHPDIMIWGTLEARVQGADLVILGGLNDGIWPAQTPPDPWLNRQMRKDAGLLLPERRIGLSAHDYQQAVAAKRVILTRPKRNADAETVPSRWLNRLTNLMAGLPEQSGPAALAGMLQRGDEWLRLAEAFEAPTVNLAPASRPSPRPPVLARPDRLSLTQIEKLIRDPYGIYARHILRLRKLQPLRQGPDQRLRGEVLHAIVEAYVKAAQTAPIGKDELAVIAEEVLAHRVAWPTARAIWRARINRAADSFIAFSNSTGGRPVLVEEMGSVTLGELAFTLFGKPDRIDQLPDGSLYLIDYKTGMPPSEDKQKAFEKQLLLAAGLAAQGGFVELGPSTVTKITYLGIKGEVEPITTLMTDESIAAVWADFKKLIRAYGLQTQGYTARRAMFETSFATDYDHLSRFGEWDISDDATPEDVG